MRAKKSLPVTGGFFRGLEVLELHAGEGVVEAAEGGGFFALDSESCDGFGSALGVLVAADGAEGNLAAVDLLDFDFDGFALRVVLAEPALDIGLGGDVEDGDVHQATAAIGEFDKDTEGLDAIDFTADRAGFGRCCGAAAEAGTVDGGDERNAAGFGVDFLDRDGDFVAGGVEIGGLFAFGQFRDVQETFEAFGDFDEEAEFFISFGDGAFKGLAGELGSMGPGILGGGAEGEADALGIPVDAADDNVDFFADADDGGGVEVALPGEFGVGDHAIGAAEVDEDAELLDLADYTFDFVAFAEGFFQLFAAAFGFFVEQGAAGDNHVVAFDLGD